MYFNLIGPNEITVLWSNTEISNQFALQKREIKSKESIKCECDRSKESWLKQRTQVYPEN